MTLLQEGQDIQGTYTIDRLLGEGAFAEVYRVKHRFLGRQAMKVFKAPGIGIDEIAEALGEAKLLSKIGHANIIRVFDANILEYGSNNLGYFTMEYVAGGTLHQHWQSYGAHLMPVGEVVGILRQVCEGIAVAHAECPPIVHRDIKPQNILIGYNGDRMRVMVSDFGLAKRVNPLTLLASAQGTLGFKPPEALDNQDSCAADVWAIGTILYLLLTDTFPYPDLEDRGVPDAGRFLSQLRPPSTYNIHVDENLDSITARCLAKTPSDRYMSAQTLLEDLNRWRLAELVRNTTADSPSMTPASSGSQASPRQEMSADALLQEALRLSGEPGHLGAAADLLEDALKKKVSLRDEYQPRLELWRRGIAM